MRAPDNLPFQDGDTNYPPGTLTPHSLQMVVWDTLHSHDDEVEMSVMSAADREVLRELAARLREVEPGARIWAFGSRVRGTSRPDSDLDVCVVVPEFSEELEAKIFHAAWEVAFEHGLVIPPIVLSNESFEHGPMSASTLVANILREGIAA